MPRTTAQLNAKIDAGLKASLDAHCLAHGQSQRQIIETLLNAYLLEREAKGVHHLDGSECPLAKLINGLTEEVRRIR